MRLVETDWNAPLILQLLCVLIYISSFIMRCNRWPDARHVHRLDQDTSGVVVMALTAEATREMCRQFRERGERCSGKYYTVRTLIYLARAPVMG